MSEISHDVTINANTATVYRALTTTDGLRGWFTSQTSGSGKVGTNWELKFTDQPSFSWNILVADQERVAWKCMQGPGNAADTEVEFAFKPKSDNQTTLTIIHRGWTKDDPKFNRCVEIWRTLMHHLQHYCEAGTAKPAYQ
jgi:uncharacterized protein YndB with AHSA1/START domain